MHIRGQRYQHRKSSFDGGNPRGQVVDAHDGAIELLVDVAQIAQDQALRSGRVVRAHMPTIAGARPLANGKSALTNGRWRPLSAAIDGLSRESETGMRRGSTV